MNRHILKYNKEKNVWVANRNGYVRNFRDRRNAQEWMHHDIDKYMRPRKTEQQLKREERNKKLKRILSNE